MRVKEKELTPMTLQDVQRVSLDILLHVHRFCVENDIKYSLGFGTLIGCIRHKGFIPWDDDLDIMMTHDNYEKFCRLYKDSKKFTLITPERRNAYIAYSRVCEMEETLVQPKSPTHTIPTGVWIDIFPLYDVDNDEQAFKKKLVSIRQIASRIYQTRLSKRSLKNIEGIKPKLRTLYRKIFWNQDILSLVDKHVELCRNFVNEPTDFYGQLGWCLKMSIAQKGRFPKLLFQEYILKDFEGFQFYVIGGYDEFLTHYYGDYMKLPPEDQRQRPHTFHHYYWKKG